jgi:hypothetical protein
LVNKNIPIVDLPDEISQSIDEYLNEIEEDLR